MPTNNRATTVLRMAATPLRESDSYLGAEFRRCRTRLGPAVATKAMAAKLARLVYPMLRYGMKYGNQGAEFDEAQHRKQRVIHLKQKAAPLGLQIIEVAAATWNHQWGFRAGVSGEIRGETPRGW
jgi:transposase